jgi:sulfotransferase family protein
VASCTSRRLAGGIRRYRSIHVPGRETKLTSQQLGVAPAPVFILCEARTGSTLLRLLLDCHPQLTCPAETNIPALCNNMVPIWSLVTGNPVPIPNMPFNFSELPKEVTEGLRKSMDLIISTHLERSGKSRWCDKSLGSARYAELLLQLYPEAKFLCLYRFPMDVIASAIEACPYGLSGYGYDPYIAASPGNSVLAVARCWLEMTAEIMSVEENFGEHCLRLRYEDLVSDPEKVMDGVLAFLGVSPAVGIAAQCFLSEPERLGMADYKIWHTNRISSDSVGRGWSIPPGMISAPILGGINDLSGRLGYISINPANWGIGPGPRELRSADSGRAAALVSAGTSREVSEMAALLGQKVQAGLDRLDGATPPKWLAVAPDMVVMSVVPDPQEHGDSAELLVNVSARTVETFESATVAAARTPDSCTLAGPAAVWRQVMAVEVNLGVAMRLNQIRFSGSIQDWRVGELTVAMISDLLGLASWHVVPAEPGRAAVAAGLA